MDWHDLIHRLRERDPTAQHEVYEAYRQRVHFVLMRLFPSATVHHADCIRDGIVDAFLELFGQPDRFDPARARARDPLLAYLIGVARRRTIDHLRRLDPDALNHLQDEPDEEDDPQDEPRLWTSNAEPLLERSLEDIIIDLDEGRLTVDEFTDYVLLQADSAAVAEILNRLTARQREVLFLKYVAEYTIKEIMQVLNLSEDAVENVLRRARDVLRGKRR